MNQTFLQKYGFIILIYIIMGLGGLWHILGLFQKTSQMLFIPLLVLLFSINLIYFINLYRDTPLLNIFFIWTGIIFITVLGVEIIGEKTGVIFGSYAYTDMLSPRIFGVPVVIGLSWLNLVFGTTQIANVYLSRYGWPYRALFAALLMTGFDGIMEPAARALGFWYWENYAVPWQNYVAWFAFGFIFTFPYLRYFPPVTDRLRMPIHILMAQFLYFALVNLG
jgi:bisanhydrobacterioruberin hydratase